MMNVRLNLPTVLGLVIICSAGAFAAGRSSSTSEVAVTSAPQGGAPAPIAALPESDELPPGHPPMGGPAASGMGALPASHPSMADPGADPAGAAAPAALDYKAPARWVVAPNTSSMRLATYKIPKAPGDTEDAELSVAQAGGSVEANASRWIGQFDAAAQKTAKRTTRKVGALDVTIVEIQGTFSAGGMGKEPSNLAGWAMLGAIVSTPGMPHFFKLTGPAKTVMAARAEFDTLLGTVATR